MGRDGVIRLFDNAPVSPLRWRGRPIRNGRSAAWRRIRTSHENQLLYLVETRCLRDPMLRLSRYREVGGVLGERAVLLESRLSATFDPDVRRLWTGRIPVRRAALLGTHTG